MRPEEMTASLTRAGLNLIQQALSIYDRDLRLVACNEPFRIMFDLPVALVTPGALFEATIAHLVQRGEYGPVEDAATAVRDRVETARAFEPHYMERCRPDGRWISVEGSPLPQGGWVTVYTDITSIKRQEAMLRLRSEELSEQLLSYAEELSETNRTLAAANAALTEARRELTEMEARIRLTTEMMPAHIAHVDRALRYTYSNRKLPHVIPGSRSDIVGLTGREAMGEAAFARILPHLQDALAGTASVLEFTHDASGRRIRAAFTPDSRAGGEVGGVYILSADVTEETQARAALVHSHKRELTAQITSGMAHDFGNLLTIILGLQSRLQHMPDLPAPAAEAVGATLSAARRGGVLLERIAAISGPPTITPVPALVSSLLADLQTLARPSLPAGMQLEVQQEGLDASLMIDTGALQDSLLNLVLNARDAMGSAGDGGSIGGKASGNGGRITIRARPILDTWLEISVDDSGPGFSETALQRGLDPFFTTKGSAGSGLGLSMVFDHMRVQGGNVVLSNLPGGGASVTLRLPLRPARGEGAPRLVLLVEDTVEIRDAVREMLCQMGHSVLEAGSAEEALALADVPGVDLVLSDVGLPGDASGVDLALALRARGHDVRLMTSLPAQDALRRRAAAAEIPVIAKPFVAPDLARFLLMEVAAHLCPGPPAIAPQGWSGSRREPADRTA